MKPLILTGWLAPEFREPEFADLALYFPFRFSWGPLPSQAVLSTYLGPRTTDVRRGHHWSDFATNWSGSESRSHKDVSLVEFCQQHESVELWFDTEPNAQLLLVWLIDYFRPHPETVARLKFRLVDLSMMSSTGSANGGRRRSLSPKRNLRQPV